MKKKTIALSILVMLLVAVPHVMAWCPVGMKSDCIINLAVEQSEKLNNLHNDFLKESLPLQNQIGIKKLEMQVLLAKSAINAKAVKSMQQEIFALKKGLQEKSLDYYLKAREILTPQQVSMLPPGCCLGFNLCGGCFKGKGCASGSGRGKGGCRKLCQYGRR